MGEGREGKWIWERGDCRVRGEERRGTRVDRGIGEGRWHSHMLPRSLSSAR